MSDIVAWLERCARAMEVGLDVEIEFSVDQFREAAAEITRRRAVEAAVREPSDELVEIVAGAIWGGNNPEQYKMSEFIIGRSRAAIKALADAALPPNGEPGDE